MKSVEVSAAIIIENGKIFVTQRGYGEFKDKWEFPGGKLEANESPEDCIVREIKEELNTDIKIVEPLGFIEFDYPNFRLKMHCFVCEIKRGNLDLLEHEAARFVKPEEFDSFDFLPADLLIIEKLDKFLSAQKTFDQIQ